MNSNNNLQTFFEGNCIPHEEYNRLYTETNSLKEQIRCQNHTIDELHQIVKNFQNIVEKQDVTIKNLENTIQQLENKEKFRDSIFKLHEFDSFANKCFKEEYKHYFHLDPYDKNVPNLRDFILNPPLFNFRTDEGEFWKYFISLHPNSNKRVLFTNIYKKLNTYRIQYDTYRMKYDAHPDVSDITEEEFEESFKLVLPEIYNSDFNNYKEYKNWIFSFVSQTDV